MPFSDKPRHIGTPNTLRMIVQLAVIKVVKIKMTLKQVFAAIAGRPTSINKRNSPTHSNSVQTDVGNARQYRGEEFDDENRVYDRLEKMFPN